MKKLTIAISLILIMASLSACSTRVYDSAWEREKLTSNMHITGARAKSLLDTNLAECQMIVASRKNMETETINTKKCIVRDGEDWYALDNQAFLRQCMQTKGWIPSGCCAFSKDCICK